MSSALMVVGAVLVLAGSLMLLAAAFHTSTGWGVSSLLIPGAVVCYVFANWREAKRGFLTVLIGSALLVGGTVVKQQEELAASAGAAPQTTDRPRGGAERPAAATPQMPPPPPSSDSGSPASPNIRWMGQAQGAGDAQRQSGAAEHSDAAATEQP